MTRFLLPVVKVRRVAGITLGSAHGPACKHEPADDANKTKPTVAGRQVQAQVPVYRYGGFGAAAAESARAGASSASGAADAPSEAEQIFGTVAGWSKSVVSGDDLSSCF